MVQSLSAGGTSLVFSNNNITSNSTFDVYTSDYNVTPTEATVSTGSLTLTFDGSSASTVSIKVVIR